MSGRSIPSQYTDTATISTHHGVRIGLHQIGLPDGRRAMANDADQLLHGTLKTRDGGELLTIVAVRSSDKPEPIALVYQLNTEQARLIAHGLIKSVERIEAHAAAQASAAIARARGRDAPA